MREELGPPSSVRVRAIAEEQPGARWQELFRSFWPAYEAWFLREGPGARPSYAESAKMLARHLPELVPIYERLVELAGGGDRVARFLSLYRPTPYLTGCSQAVWVGDVPALVRNYDYSPTLWEGVVLATAWRGTRVLAMSDCLWGVLDGMNEHGLVASLSFGGRKVVGDGFGSPLLLRYLLELCRDAREAAELLARVPSHMAYNVTLLDASGDFRTVWLAPDRPAVVRRWPIATNHQGELDWPEYSQATGSEERERFLAACLGNPTQTCERLIDAFLEPPLYTRDYARARGTLYTAIYYPTRGAASFRWPEARMDQTLAGFREQELSVTFAASADRVVGLPG